MTAKLIFKMELFKFLRDKSFLITAGVISIINIVLTLLLLNESSNVNNYYDSSTTGTFIGTLVGVSVLIAFGNIIFAWVYPFHMISMDYKNNVMSMMVASGVNRQKLFFAKIGAIFVCTLILMAAITLIPLILCVIKLAQINALDQVKEVVSEIFSYSGISGFQLFLNMFVQYINSLMLIATACILMKGRNISFLVFMGFSIINSIVSGILNTIPNAFMFSFNGMFSFQLIVSLLSTAIFCFISLRILEKQNL